MDFKLFMEEFLQREHNDFIGKSFILTSEGLRQEKEDVLGLYHGTWITGLKFYAEYLRTALAGIASITIGKSNELNDRFDIIKIQFNEVNF